MRSVRQVLAASLAVGLLAASAIAADDTTPDLMPGVDLVTEEVEPGVYRVVGDGVRELVRPADRRSQRRGLGDFSGNVVAGLDGSVWLFDRDGFFRLGQDAEHRWPKGVIKHFRPGTEDIEVGPDGTIWLTATISVSGKARSRISSYDGRTWSNRWRGAYGKNGNSGHEWALGVEVQQDGEVSMAWVKNRAKRNLSFAGPVRAARLGADRWEVLPGRVKAGPLGHIGDVVAAEGGGSDVWLMSGWSGTLYHHDGAGWVVQEAPDPGGVMRAAVGADGTLWVRLMACRDPDAACFGASDVLAHFDGGDWETFDSSDGIPMIGDHYQGFEGFFDVAPDRSIWFNPIGDWERTGTECDGIANFDGEAVTYFLRDTCIYAMDIAPDGTVWFQAGEFPDAEGSPTNTYAITPEAVAE